MFKHAPVRVVLSRDLSFGIRINEGTFKGNFKLFFGFAPKNWDDIVDRKIMPADFIDQVYEFAKANTWSWWIFSQGLKFYIIVNYIPTEEVQRYIADLFMYIGGV